jgi:hypothetical protein
LEGTSFDPLAKDAGGGNTLDCHLSAGRFLEPDRVTRFERHRAPPPQSRVGSNHDPPRSRVDSNHELVTALLRLTPAAPEDLADVLAFALRFVGRKRKHDAGEFMA